MAGSGHALVATRTGELTLLERAGIVLYRLGWIGIAGFFIAAITVGSTFLDP